MITQFTPIADQPKLPMWTPPQGWFRAYHLERDAQAMLTELEHDNESRRQRGLPTFTPSIELARKIVSNHSPQPANAQR